MVCVFFFSPTSQATKIAGIHSNATVISRQVWGSQQSMDQPSDLEGLILGLEGRL